MTLPSVEALADDLQASPVQVPGGTVQRACLATVFEISGRPGGEVEESEGLLPPDLFTRSLAGLGCLSDSPKVLVEPLELLVRLRLEVERRRLLSHQPSNESE